MPVRRLTPEEADARKTDLERAMGAVPVRKLTYLGYLYPTDVREKWTGYIKLYDRTYNIAAWVELDAMQELRLCVEFQSDTWLANGGEQVMHFYHRVGRTYGGDIVVPSVLRPEDSPEVVKISFSYQNPNRTQLVGRREFSWRISQRGLRS